MGRPVKHTHLYAGPEALRAVLDAHPDYPSAARALGVPVGTLVYAARKYGVEPESVRDWHAERLAAWEPVRPPEEWKALAAGNLGLVYHIVRRLDYIETVARDPEEYVSVGMVALVRAAMTWREDGGSTFAGHACRLIRWAVYNALRDRGRERLTAFDHGHPPAPEAAEPEYGEDDKGRLTAALPALPPRWLTVLTLRYGLDGRGERSLQEVGASFGVSYQAVGQLRDKGLRRLRQLMGVPRTARRVYHRRRRRASS